MKSLSRWGVVQQLWAMSGALLCAPLVGHAQAVPLPVHAVPVRGTSVRAVTLPRHYRKVTLHHQTYYYFQHHYYAVSGRTLERIPAARLLSFY